MSDSEEQVLQFSEMGLDSRLLKAIADSNWTNPTVVQEKAIPLALEGKDILVNARTGSGKTAAFAIPIIQNILHIKETKSLQCVRAIIMTPSRELCKQAEQHILQLTNSIRREVKVADISAQGSIESQRALLMEQPDIVVGTPSKVKEHLNAKSLTLKRVKMLAIDEADLLMSFGFQSDMDYILNCLPKVYQGFMTSATLSSNLKDLKKCLLHNPVILKLNDTESPVSKQLKQYILRTTYENKFLIVYVMLKLHLIKGKTLIFTNHINRSYKLKLFLEQFSIKSCVLNSKMPINSRCHIISQFNAGHYNFIIASDEDDLTITQAPVKKKSKRKKVVDAEDQESSVSRGIDFQYLSNVLNFDFPKTLQSYIHRVGRTARGDKKGSALSLITKQDEKMLKEVETFLKQQCKKENIFQPFNFPLEQVEGFSYRVQAALEAVSKKHVELAHKSEIRKEICTSQKLKKYFEENPQDLEVLRHDTIRKKPIEKHLKNVPSYLIPEALAGAALSTKEVKHKNQRKRNKKKEKTAAKGEASNPLETFQFDGSTNRKKAQKRKIPSDDEGDDTDMSED